MTDKKKTAKTVRKGPFFITKRACRVLLLLFLLAAGCVVPWGGLTAAPWDAYQAYLPETAPMVKREFRAAWVASVTNLDWPSKDSLAIQDKAARAERQKQELTAILDDCIQMRLNAVIFQVRPAADSLYPSDLAPWSYFLTDRFGADPGYDPLAFAVEQAHARGLEFHAWFNPYRVSMQPDAYHLKTLDEVKAMLQKDAKSIYAKHPEWVKTAQNRLVLDPGIPDAGLYVEDCVMEVVTRYDIDAVHFDDYFYIGETGVQGGDGIMDTDTYERYNNGVYATIDEWRRGNTQRLMERLSQKIKEAKPWVKFGVSPAGVWRNRADDPALGSDTRAGLPNYDHAYADTRQWMLENTVDYIIPQIYWSFGSAAAPYGTIAEWWAQTLQANPAAHLYIGVGLYRLTEPTTDPYFKTDTGEGFREIERQITYNLACPGIGGTTLFRYGSLTDQKAAAARGLLQNTLWRAPALVPQMPRLGGTAPAAPSLALVRSNSDSVWLMWYDTEPSADERVKTKYYAVYRAEAGAPLDPSDQKNLVAVVPADEKGYAVYRDFAHTDGQYAVTAFNRLHDESAPSGVQSAGKRLFRMAHGSE